MASFKERIQEIKEYLGEKETILAFVSATYSGPLRITNLNRSGIAVLTETRIMFFIKRYIIQERVAFKYSDLSYFEKSKSSLGISISFDFNNENIKFKWISEGEIDLFLSIMKEKIKN